MGGEDWRTGLDRLKSLRSAQSAELTEEEKYALGLQGERLREQLRAGRETGPVRKRFMGNPEIAQRFMGPARVLLGQLKADMAHNALAQGVRRAVIPINQRIDLGPFRSTGPGRAGEGDTSGGAYFDDSGAFNDWLLNPTGGGGGAGERAEETSERRLTGQVSLYALSNHGLDEVWIDASAVTLREHTVTTSRGGLEYHPYLWVGAKVIAGGDGWFDDFRCTDELAKFDERAYYDVIIITGKGRKFAPQLMLNVWEPLPEGDPIENTIASNRHYYSPGNASAEDYPLRDPNAMSIGTFDDFLDGEGAAIYDEVPDDLVTYTDNNLYHLGGPWAWDPAKEPDLWEQVVVLDPQDKAKEWTSTFAYKTAIETIPARPVNSTVKWYLPGKVLPGNYLISLSYRGPNCNSYCDHNIPGPATVLIEVRLGQAPGRIMKQEFTFEIPAARGAAGGENRAHIPYGFHNGIPGTGNLPNVYGIHWIPGAIVANVALGACNYDPSIVPRGLGGGPPLDTVCEPQEITKHPWAGACVGQFIDVHCVQAVYIDIEGRLVGVFPNQTAEFRARKRIYGAPIPPEDGGSLNMVTAFTGYQFAWDGGGHEEEGLGAFMQLGWSDWIPETPGGLAGCVGCEGGNIYDGCPCPFWDAILGGPWRGRGHTRPIT